MEISRPKWLRWVLVMVLLTALGFLVFMASSGRHAQAAAPDCTGGPTTAGTTVTGTACRDVIVATPGVLTVDAEAGDDTIYAPVGVEIVNAGDGDDTIYAAPSGLTVEGGPGADTFFGDLPDAKLAKAARRSRLASTSSICPGTSCNPTNCPSPCFMGDGTDTFSGGTGPDTAYGMRGNDILNGGQNNDRLFGGIGDDTIDGGTDHDLVSGGFGWDDVQGNWGNDLVRGDGSGDKVLSGGPDSDTLSYANAVTPGFTAQSVPYPNFPTGSGERGVYLDLSTGAADNGLARYGGGLDTDNDPFSSRTVRVDFEKVIGSPFSDYIAGDTGANTIYGGGGGDVILGGDGNDTLYGGADGDHLDGGLGTNTLNGGNGNDFCGNPSSGTSCEPTINTGGVQLRATGTVSVGYTTSNDGSFAHDQLYLAGSTGHDHVTVTYNGANVTFDRISDASNPANFNTATAAQTPGCSYTTTQVTCSVGKTIDAIVVAGVGGGDTLAVHSFPTITGVVVLGGEGADAVEGGPGEDVIVDGPDSSGTWNDPSLTGFAMDDALVNNDGQDALAAGSDSDLLLSASVCDNDTLDGGAGKDNSSWAKLSGQRVDARLYLTPAKVGNSNGPACSSGTLDTLLGIEDLEGSAGDDILMGDDSTSWTNQLIGRSGVDVFFGRAGNDQLRTNSADSEPFVNCDGGAPGTDGANDEATIDKPANGTDSSVNCDGNVSQADPAYTGQGT